MVNLGVEFLENNNQKLILFNLLRAKGFGKKSFQEIHFTPYSHFYTGSHVPVLELEKELLERIKKIFETGIDYINLLLYLNKLIDCKRKAIEKRIGKRVLNFNLYFLLFKVPDIINKIYCFITKY